uniref:Uncharacterized protein n=1 Tax=Anopheles maculatus TaxID=74869 RepID=A0A182SQB0_9DIPT
MTTCSNNRVHTAHPQMKPISLNLSYPDGRSDVSGRPKETTGGGERRASMGEFAVKKSCNHPAGTKAPITTLGRSASSGKLFYIRERHEGEDLLANLLRLRKLMMGAISNDVVTN